MSKVIVTTRAGESIRGYRRPAVSGVKLTEAELLARNVEPTKLEGEVRIPRNNVAMVQVLR